MIRHRKLIFFSLAPLSVLFSLWFSSPTFAADVTFQYTNASNTTIRATGGPFDTYSSALKKDHKFIDGAGTGNTKVFRSHPDLTISNYPNQCITSISVTSGSSAILRLLDCNNADKQDEITKALSQYSDLSIKVNPSSEQILKEEMNRDRALYTQALRNSSDALSAFCEDMADKSECSNDIGAVFQSCFNGHVSDNSFTYPNYDISTLAGCLAGNDRSKSTIYRTALATVDAEAKQDNRESVTATTIGETINPDTAGASSCVIEGIGWLLCPVLTFTAGIVDAAYGFVASLLTVQPLMTTGDTSGVYNGWVIMRNVANVAFVISFLIIIFSQLTGMGVSNYGVKKLLPRLVISAILVNISFWVCAIAVDISNILGTSIVQVFDFVGGSIPTAEGVSIGDTGGGWTDIVAWVISGGVAAGALYFVGLSALIPALLLVVVAIITVFLVLTLRQALIILLVVVAPLAFVAYLLPNTEEWFSRWRKLLMTLLLMYPIIAGIFGASALASQIVMNSASGDYKVAIQIMGACIAILPLAITPIVMKTAGGVLNRFAGIVNNAERGPVDRLRKNAEKYREGRQNLRNARALGGDKQFGRGSFVRWRSRRGAITSGRQAEAGRANTEYVANEIEKNGAFRNAMAGGTAVTIAGKTIGRVATDEASQRALATSINAKAKIEAEELSAASVVLKNARLTQDENRVIAGGGTIQKGTTTFNGGTSTAVRAAAIQQSVASNDVAAMNSLWNESKSWSGESGSRLREAFADSLQSSSIRPGYMSQGAIAGLRTNEHSDVRKTIESAIKNNTYSPEKIASADKDELNVIAQVLEQNHTVAKAGGKPVIEDSERQKILLNAEQALNDPRIRTAIGKNLSQVENIVNFRASKGTKEDPRIYIDAASARPADGGLNINHTPPQS